MSCRIAFHASVLDLKTLPPGPGGWNWVYVLPRAQPLPRKWREHHQSTGSGKPVQLICCRQILLCFAAARVSDQPVLLFPYGVTGQSPWANVSSVNFRKASSAFAGLHSVSCNAARSSTVNLQGAGMAGTSTPGSCFMHADKVMSAAAD